MKILKIIAIVVVVMIVVATIAVYLVAKNFDINSKKPEITAQLSNAIGHDVKIGNMALNISLKGISLGLDQLLIADNPKISSEPLLKVESAGLYVDVLSFITKGQLVVSSIELKAPKIRVIRSSDGEINVATLVPNTEKGEASGKSKEQSKSKPNNASAAAAMPTNLLVKTIHLSDGELTFIDHQTSPPVTIPVKMIDLKIHDISFTRPFNYELNAAFWSNQQNAKVKGLAQMVKGNNQIRLDDVKFTMDLSTITVKDLLKDIPSIEPVLAGNNMEGTFEADIAQMILGADGLLVLSLNSQLKNGKVQLKSLAVPFSQINFQTEMNDSIIRLTNLQMNLGSGRLSAQGQMNDYLKEQKMSVKASVSDVKLEEILPKDTLPAKIEGKLVGQMNFEGASFNVDQLIQSASGQSQFEIKDGKILDINVLNFILSKISIIPGLGQKLEENLPPAYREKMKNKDTILKSVVLTATLAQGSALIKEALVDADDFSLTANGSVKLPDDLSIDGNVYFSEELSKVLTNSVPELAALVDQNNRISVPLIPYRGKANKFIMYPDMEMIGKKVIQTKGKEELKNTIFKAIGIDEDEAPPTENQGQQPDSEQKGRPEKAIIENVIDSIFK